MTTQIETGIGQIELGFMQEQPRFCTSCKKPIEGLALTTSEPGEEGTYHSTMECLPDSKKMEFAQLSIMGAC